MTVSFYMDEHIPRPIVTGLRLRGVDVLTVQEDGMTGRPDPDILDRADELQRILFTFDEDFLVETAGRLNEGRSFAGVVYAHADRVRIGECVTDLELIAGTMSYGEMKDSVLYLPL